MTRPSVFDSVFKISATKRASRVDCKNNPELKRKFPLVPGPKMTKKAGQDGTKTRFAAKIRRGDAAG
jgi:hypothetical protein